MTITGQRHQDPPPGLLPGAQVRLAEQVRVAVIFSGQQTDMSLPAASPVAAVVDALARILQGQSEDEGGLRRPDDAGMISAGLVTLTRMDGRPLDRTQSLSAQGVADGDLLVLEGHRRRDRVHADHRIPVERCGGSQCRAVQCRHGRYRAGLCRDCRGGGGRGRDRTAGLVVVADLGCGS
jgi:hypothetical protein